MLIGSLSLLILSLKFRVWRKSTLIHTYILYIENSSLQIIFSISGSSLSNTRQVTYVLIFSRPLNSSVWLMLLFTLFLLIFLQFLRSILQFQNSHCLYLQSLMLFLLTSILTLKIKEFFLLETMANVSNICSFLQFNF